MVAARVVVARVAAMAMEEMVVVRAAAARAVVVWVEVRAAEGRVVAMAVADSTAAAGMAEARRAARVADGPVGAKRRGYRAKRRGTSPHRWYQLSCKSSRVGSCRLNV